MPFKIASLRLLKGRIGICPMPGRDGDYRGDLADMMAWSPGLVLTLATAAELAEKGASDLPADLAGKGVAWVHLPVADFATPAPPTDEHWPEASLRARSVLAGGGRVLAHCMGGCGRSGMALMRLMVDTGETPDGALAHLRAVRPCAVETPEQLAWASRA